MKMNFKLRWIFVLPAIGLMLAALLIQAADLSKQPARPSPDWLRDAVIYEIFPRDFSVAGNLNAVTAKLDQIKDLGVTVLWIMPIHPIGEKGRKGNFGSPYSIRDYYAVDPNYGTLGDFKNLVTQAHKRGLKVIMDLVANHTSWDSVMMTNKDFYKQDAQGNIISPQPGWSDVAGLNYANQQLREYMIAMMNYWIQTCNIDGYRCDVAWGVPTDFWEQARVALEKTKPDIMMLAEANKPELLTNAFDLDYSWPLLHTLNDVVMHGAPASKFQVTWQEDVSQFPQNALHMRISDDHDESRAIARFGINSALAAQVLMFSLDGVPVLYNGMEVGDATESGDPALFDKLPIVWAPRERPPFRDIYRSLIQLRKKYSAFTSSRVTWLRNSDENNLVTLMRSDKNDEFVVVINFSNRPITGSVKLENGPDFQLMKISGLPDAHDSSLPLFHLNGFEWRIYHRAVAR
jgi:cyclomaltodextrinase / maltogenic alpha-amylase / neopullulanase